MLPQIYRYLRPYPEVYFIRPLDSYENDTFLLLLFKKVDYLDNHLRRL